MVRRLYCFLFFMPFSIGTLLCSMLSACYYTILCDIPVKAQYVPCPMVNSHAREAVGTVGKVA